MKRLFLYSVFILFAGSIIGLSGCHPTDSTPNPSQDTTDTGSNYVIQSPVTQRIVDNTGLISKVYDDTVFQVTKGVKETDIYYKNHLDYHMHVFILRVDLTNPKISMEAAMLYNGSTFERQTVRAMAKEADRAAHRVVAAVNADFFTVKAPWGIVIKDDKVLKDTWSRPRSRTFLATLSSSGGRAYIGDRQDFTDMRNLLKDALGGSEMLIEAGIVQPETITARAPRTAAGITGDQILYLVVVDGRKTDYSRGMTLQEEAIMLNACGAIKAMNFDGGGSSTFLIRHNGKWDVRNRPSDGSLRKVSNAWLVNEVV